MTKKPDGYVDFKTYLPGELRERFKLQCARLGHSMTTTVEELVRQFTEMYEADEREQSGGTQ